MKISVQVMLRCSIILNHIVEALFVVEGLALTNVNYLPSIINCNSSLILRKSYAKDIRQY